MTQSTLKRTNPGQFRVELRCVLEGDMEPYVTTGNNIRMALLSVIPT